MVDTERMRRAEAIFFKLDWHIVRVIGHVCNGAGQKIGVTGSVIDKMEALGWLSDEWEDSELTQYIARGDQLKFRRDIDYMLNLQMYFPEDVLVRFRAAGLSEDAVMRFYDGGMDADLVLSTMADNGN